MQNTSLSSCNTLVDTTCVRIERKSTKIEILPPETTFSHLYDKLVFSNGCCLTGQIASTGHTCQVQLYVMVVFYLCWVTAVIKKWCKFEKKSWKSCVSLNCHGRHEIDVRKFSRVSFFLYMNTLSNMWEWNVPEVRGVWDEFSNTPYFLQILTIL